MALAILKASIFLNIFAALCSANESHLSEHPKHQAKNAVYVRKLSTVETANSDHINKVRDMIDTLVLNYNKEVILQKPVVIHMDILLLQVKSTIEREGILESVVALIVEWKDLRMKWNPFDYHNITFISLTPDQVWMPDIAMTNAADHPYAISGDKRFTVRVTFDGSFKFVPTGTARSWCELDLWIFPFDVQHCSLEFESWSLDSNTMTFDGLSKILVDDAFASTQFHLCGLSTQKYYHTYHFTGETFTRIKFDFTVKRKSTFYVINLIFPIMILSFIQSLTFIIPCRETTADRITFGTTNMLTLVVYQTIITEQLPKTSDAVTALSKYVITLIVLAAVGIFESVMVDRILARSKGRPPLCVMRLFKSLPNLMKEMPKHFGTPQFPRRGCLMPSLKLRTPARNVCYRTWADIGKANIGFEADEFANAFSPSCASLSTADSFRLAVGNGENELKRKNVRQRRFSLKSYHRQLHSTYDKKSKVIKSQVLKKRKLFLFQEMDDQYYHHWAAAEPIALWTELAFKIDTISFIACSCTAVLAPVVLFLIMGFFAQSDILCRN